MPKVFAALLWIYAVIAMIFTALLVVVPEIRSGMTQEQEALRIVGLVVFGLLLAKAVAPIGKE